MVESRPVDAVGAVGLGLVVVHGEVLGVEGVLQLPAVGVPSRYVLLAVLLGHDVAGPSVGLEVPVPLHGEVDAVLVKRLVGGPVGDEGAVAALQVGHFGARGRGVGVEGVGVVVACGAGCAAVDVVVAAARGEREDEEQEVKEGLDLLLGVEMFHCVVSPFIDGRRECPPWMFSCPVFCADGINTEKSHHPSLGMMGFCVVSCLPLTWRR